MTEIEQAWFHVTSETVRLSHLDRFRATGTVLKNLEARLVQMEQRLNMAPNGSVMDEEIDE